MLFLKQTGLVLFALTCVSAVPNPGSHSQGDLVSELLPRQGSFTTQNWGNENSNYTFDRRSGGEYAIVWDQPSSGNFVVGKGYRGQGM
jgi:hypothetical protein